MNEPTDPLAQREQGETPQQPLLATLMALRQEALVHHQRRMIVAAGDLHWCNQLADALVAQLGQPHDSTLWIAREWPEPPNRLQQIIGGETQLLIFNAHHGFDPNLFGAATGTVIGGGLILLLTPEFSKWSTKSDPVSSRITVYPHLPESISNHYIARLIRMIAAGEREQYLITIHQDSCSTDLRPQPSDKLPPAPPLHQSSGTPEQQLAIDAILHCASGHRHRPLVLTAARGRGKSAALGIAAARLLAEGNRQIIVTAPSRAAVTNLFKHAHSEGAGLVPPQSLQFIAPDELITGQFDAALILVDEAAAIPIPILTKIVERYPRVVFATTTHGYEGSGQGFALRFLQQLHQLAPGYQEIHLNRPIRWAEGDPVEAQVNRMLLLDAEPTLASNLLTTGNSSTNTTGTIQIEQIERLERKELAGNEPLLRQLFGLLILAHYRTTPLDLRQLLDGPNISIYSATHQGSLIATALVADEGLLDTQLAHEIWLGRRRPQGHLLPQTLLAHLGIKDAAPLKYRRIIRIAVHPELQRRGIGRALVDKIIADAASEQIDLVGTSYGATSALIDFWNQCQLTTIAIGGQRNASSGTYALTQLRALSRAGESIVALAEARFQSGLPAQLRDPLRQLESEIIQRLLKPIPIQLDPHDLNDINAFADGNRRYESVITPLTQLLLARFDQSKQLSPLQQQLLILRLLQNRPWAECAALLNMAGESALLQQMRSAIAQLRNYL
jgi:tRNA(Met) cytidine acetyltransferase